MFWQNAASQLRTLGTAPCAKSVMLVFAIAAMFMVLMAAAADACPSSAGPTHFSADADNSSSDTTVLVSVTVVNGVALATGQCCATGAPSCSGSGGCCTVCSAAIGVASSHFMFHVGRIGHVSPAEANVISTKPPPEFRPPRILV